MRELRATMPWLLLALALTVWWRDGPTPTVTVPSSPPLEVGNSVAMTTVALPAPPPRPAAEAAPEPRGTAAPPAVPAPESDASHAVDIQPLRPMPPAPDPAPSVATPLRPTPQPPTPREPIPRRPVAPPQAAAATEATEDGRALLRLLEHGRGPQISIDWPGGAERRRLTDLLARCHGMRVALLDRDGRLWREAGPSGQPWHANPDRFSGFLRIGAGDAAEADRIRRKHGVAGEPVRLFPRAVDAGLLASLRQAVGNGYGGARQIRLRYRLEAGRVVLDSIRVDGRPLPGFIRLAGADGCLA